MKNTNEDEATAKESPTSNLDEKFEVLVRLPQSGLVVKSRDDQKDGLVLIEEKVHGNRYANV